MRRTRSLSPRRLAPLAFVLLSCPLFAAANGSGPAPEFSASGDLRLRYEGFSAGSLGNEDARHRFRYRVRLSGTVTFSERWRLGGELRSGNPDNPVSDNQSFDGSGSKKDFSIAEAWVEWRPDPRARIQAGKISPKSLWWSSDLQYDDDIVPEGLLGRYESRAEKAGRPGFGVAGYVFSLEESRSGSDSWLAGAQAVVNWAWASHALRVGAGYDSISSPQAVAELTLDGDLGGNDMTNLVDEAGQLVSDFRTQSLFGQWKISRERWPIKISAHVYRNAGAEGVGEDLDTAWFARIQVGDDGRPRGTAVRVSRYRSDPDALFYVYTQSDTSRGSNVDGYRVDFRHRVAPWGKINVTWYHTEEAVAPTDTMDRLQVDFIASF